jgi:hypothetical protein
VPRDALHPLNVPANPCFDMTGTKMNEPISDCKSVASHFCGIPACMSTSAPSVVRSRLIRNFFDPIVAYVCGSHASC